MSKRKIILHLNSDEIAVVWTEEMWRHLVLTYETCASYSEDDQERSYWLDCAAYIKRSIETKKKVPQDWSE